MQDQQLLTDILRALLSYQRANRYVANAWGALSINQQQLIAELGYSPVKRVSDLARSLKLELSAVSHLVKQLSKQGLLVKITGLGDPREVHIGLSPTGRKLLWKIDQVGNAITTCYSSKLTANEQEQVLQFWSTVADFMRVEAAAPRPGEHPLRPQIRRVTRGLGVSVLDFAQSGLRVVEMQALYLLLLQPRTVEEIARELSFSFSSAWRLSLTLDENKLVLPEESKKRSSKKARQRVLVISDLGKQTLFTIEKKVVERFMQGVQLPSDLVAKLRSWLVLHQKGLLSLQELELPLPSIQVSVTTLKDFFEVQMAQLLLTTNQSEKAQQTSLDKNNKESLVGLWFGFWLVGVLQIAPKTTTTIVGAALLSELRQHPKNFAQLKVRLEEFFKESKLSMDDQLTEVLRPLRLTS